MCSIINNTLIIKTRNLGNTHSNGGRMKQPSKSRKEMDSMKEENGWGLTAGLLIGAVIGAAAAALLTQTTGEEARQFLMDNIYRPVREKAEELRVTVTETADETKTKLADMKQRAGEMLES